MNDGNTNGNSLVQDLDRIAQARQEFAGYLFNMSGIIDEAEAEAPAKLELRSSVDLLNKTAQNLKDGVFRLLVLGDMKRGKSTFLNALLGEIVLPSDVNPCTAILTKLRFGQNSGANVFFSDGKQPEPLSLADFNKQYTISADEAKRYEKENKAAFPDVSHAEIEYPLEILEKGVEIIDSPGLNDTEERNELSLGFIQNSHAILFVLSATQQFTLGEKRYLENYMRGKGLPVFFLINMWDDIPNKLFDPHDQMEVAKKEGEVREVFRTKLAEHTVVNNKNLYNQRVFEISALNALRYRLGREGSSWEKSGFAAFTEALSRFLTQDRAIAEMQLARLTARNTAQTVRDKAELQIKLLSESTIELRERIKNVQPEFNELTSIKDHFNEEIEQVRKEVANDLATSFKEYFSTLDQTFEQDFLPYIPEISAIKFLRKENREQFQSEMETNYELYLKDKIADWSGTADTKMQTAYTELSRKAAQYAISYAEVTHRMTATLTEEKSSKAPKELLEDSPLWQRMLAGGVALASGDVAGAAMSGSGVFNWKTIFINLGIVLATYTALAVTVGVVLTPIGTSLVGALLGGWQLRKARRQFVESAKTELAKQLPEMAEKGSDKIFQTVHQQFAEYGAEVEKLINADIESRREQLNNLLEEREKREIDIGGETNRLQKMMQEIDAERNKVETTFDRMLGVDSQAVTV